MDPVTRSLDRLDQPDGDLDAGLQFSPFPGPLQLLEEAFRNTNTGEMFGDVLRHLQGTEEKNAGDDFGILLSSLFHELHEAIGVKDRLGLEEAAAALNLSLNC